MSIHNLLIIYKSFLIFIYFDAVALLTVGLLTALCLHAQSVDTVAVFSQAMKRPVNNVVILPANHDTRSDIPVVYLLHGYGGNHKTWIGIRPDLPQIADKLGVIIVCPDGRNSWYLDSKVNPESQYETYISKELVHYMDSAYHTLPAPAGRAITGLSMGGFGAMWNAINHQDVFGACGSTSGGVDIRPFPRSWKMSEVLGEYAENTDDWDQVCVIENLHKVKPELSIIFDCGSEDFFFPVNNRLHEEMLFRNIRHDYISRPGAHNAPYWSNSIIYQLIYFYNYFINR